MSLRVTIAPAPKETKLPNGQKYTPYGGRVFARFSPDKKHWSSWQPLQHDAKEKKALAFYGQLGVPRRASRRYDALLSAYMRRKDVPWSSDEEALVRSIVKRDPRFFEREKPFIGYVQLLWEGSFHGRRRLTRLDVRASYAVGGIHTTPKDKSVYKNRDGVWRFVAP